MAINSVNYLKSINKTKVYRLGTSENFTFDAAKDDGICLVLPTSYAGTITNTAMENGQTMSMFVTTETDPRTWFDYPALGAADYNISGMVEIEMRDGARYALFNAMGAIDADFSSLTTWMPSISMLYTNRVNISAIAASKTTLVYTVKTQTLTNKTVSAGTVKDNTLIFKKTTPVNAVNASKRTDTGIASADLIFTAKVAGTTGNVIKYRYVGGKPSSALAVTVPSANYIRIKLQTTALSAISCTASQIKAAVKALAAASALVGTPAIVSGGGASIVSSMATALTLIGGVDGTTGASRQVVADGSYIYYCVAPQTASGKNWRKISVGAAY